MKDVQTLTRLGIELNPLPLSTALSEVSKLSHSWQCAVCVCVYICGRERGGVCSFSVWFCWRIVLLARKCVNCAYVCMCICVC
jgi:hypothetical protein